MAFQSLLCNTNIAGLPLAMASSLGYHSVLTGLSDTSTDQPYLAGQFHGREDTVSIGPSSSVLIGDSISMGLPVSSVLRPFQHPELKADFSARDIQRPAAIREIHRKLGPTSLASVMSVVMLVGAASLYSSDAEAGSIQGLRPAVITLASAANSPGSSSDSITSNGWFWAFLAVTVLFLVSSVSVIRKLKGFSRERLEWNGKQEDLQNELNELSATIRENKQGAAIRENELEDEIGKKDDEISERLEELEAAKEKLLLAERALTEIQAGLDKISTAKAQKEQMDDLMRQVEELEQQLVDLEPFTQRSEDLKQRIALGLQQKAQLGDLKSRYAEIQADLQEDRAALGERKTDLEAERQGLLGEIELVRERREEVDRLRAENPNLEEDNERSRVELATLLREVAKLKAKINERKDLQDELAKLERENPEIDKKVTDLNEQAEPLREKRQVLEKALEAVQTEIGELTEKVRELEGSLTERRGEWDNISSREGELRREIAQIEEVIGVFTGVMEGDGKEPGLKVMKNELVRRLDQLRGETQILSQKVQGLKAELLAEGNRHAALVAEHRDVKKNITFYYGENAKLTAQIERYRRLVAEREKKVEELNALRATRSEQQLAHDIERFDNELTAVRAEILASEQRLAQKRPAGIEARLNKVNPNLYKLIGNVEGILDGNKGRYEIEGLLDVGREVESGSIVYLARDLNTGQRVVVKQLLFNYADIVRYTPTRVLHEKQFRDTIDELRHSLKNEERILERDENSKRPVFPRLRETLVAPAIVKAVKGHRILGEEQYLIEEYIEGKNLAELVAQPEWTTLSDREREEHAAQIAWQYIDFVVRLISSVGWYYWDIRPENFVYDLKEKRLRLFHPRSMLKVESKKIALKRQDQRLDYDNRFMVPRLKDSFERGGSIGNKLDAVFPILGKLLYFVLSGHMPVDESLPDIEAFKGSRSGPQYDVLETFLNLGAIPKPGSTTSLEDQVRAANEAMTKWCNKFGIKML